MRRRPSRSTVTWILAGAVASVLAIDVGVLVARTPGDEDTSPSSTPSSVPVMGAEVYGPRTLRIIDALTTGGYEQVTADFSPELLERVPARRLEEIWNREVAEGGPFLGLGERAFLVRDELRLVEVRVRFERREKTVRVVYDAGGQVSGFFILP